MGRNPSNLALQVTQLCLSPGRKRPLHRGSRAVACDQWRCRTGAGHERWTYTESRCDCHRGWAGGFGGGERALRPWPVRPAAGPGGRAEPGRSGVLVAGRVVHGRHAGTAAHEDPRFAGTGAVGLDGFGAVRRPAGYLATPHRRGVCRFRRHRNAALAARAGNALVPGGRLGRARRRDGARPWQHRAPLSCDLGHRPGRSGPVPAPGAPA